MFLHYEIKNQEALDLHSIIQRIPPGYSEVYVGARRYSLTREDLAGGRSIKVFARELGGTDFISFNYYITSDNTHLKPCEMPQQKVIAFLLQMQIIRGKDDP